MMMQSKSVIDDKDRYVSGSSKFQTSYHVTQVESYSNGKNCRLIKLVFFIFKCIMYM